MVKNYIKRLHGATIGGSGMGGIHYFNIKAAVEVGVSEAIVLQNIWHWVQHNEQNNTNVHDGKAWTYNSLQAFSEQFPYFSARQIRSIMQKLKAHGLIETGNFNRLGFDRTTWYTITPKAREILGVDEKKELSGQNNGLYIGNSQKSSHGETNRSHAETKRSNGFDQTVPPIPNINADINADKSIKRDIDQIAATPLSRSGNDEPDDFTAFWKAYPKKSSKPQALKAWKAKSKAKALPALSELLTAIERWKTTRQWQDKAFIPNPATFINNEKWADDIPENNSHSAYGKNDNGKRRYVRESEQNFDNTPTVMVGGREYTGNLDDIF